MSAGAIHILFAAQKILSNLNDFNKNFIPYSVNFSQCSRHWIDAKLPVMKDKMKRAQALPNGDGYVGDIGENGKR